MKTPNQIQDIPLEKILISEFNTRQPKPADPDVISLAKSLDSRGQITPGKARPHPKKQGFYELAAGARRSVALGVAGKATMRLEIEEMTDQELKDTILVENLQRLDPHPREEAKLIANMLKGGKHTIAEIAAHCGRPESWAARRVKLLDVIPELLALWEPGKELSHYSAEMMEFLGSLPKEMQKSAPSEHFLQHMDSRKQLEARFAGKLCRLDMFDLEDPRFFVPNCGPGCASDSRKGGQLFDFDEGKKKECGRCLNTGCFLSRLAKFREAEVERLSNGEKLPLYSEAYNDTVQIGTEKVKARYGYNLAPKETPGAERVLLLTDTKKLVVRWVPASEKPSSSGGRGVIKSDKEKRKEKVALLQSNRWKLVREDLIKALKDAPLTDLTCDVVDLVTAIGLPYRLQSERYSVDTRAWKIMEHRLAGFPIYKQSQREMANTVPRGEALWSAAKSVLLSLIPEPAKVSDMVNYVPNLEGIAGLIKFPIDSKKREADLKILPPKSWGPTDPHTLEPIKAPTTVSKLAAAAKVPVPKITAKPKTKSKAGAWIDVGDTGKKKAPAVAKDAKKPAKK